MQPAITQPPAGAPSGPPSARTLLLLGLAGVFVLGAAVIVSLRAAGGLNRDDEHLVRIEALSAAPTVAASAATVPADSTTPGVTRPFLSATDPALEEVVRTVLDGRLDHYSVVVKEMDTGTGMSLSPDRVFYAASLFKLAVMYEAFRQAEAGRIQLSSELTVTGAALAEDLGTLDKVSLAVGDRYSIGRLVELMIVFSDNTASVLLRDALGRENIDQTLRDLGLRSTVIDSPDLPTTAGDMALLSEAIATGRGVGEAARREMRQMLTEQSVRGRIPAGIPAGVPVANKTGTWDDAGHDVAIVYAPSGTYLLTVLSDLTVRDDLIADLSRRIYAYYAGRSR